MGLSPADARVYSLLANIKLAQKEPEEAAALFKKALRQAPTERSALLNMIRMAARQGDLKTVVEKLDILLRRWPGEFERVKKLLLAMTGSASGRILLQDKLLEHPPWRAKAFTFLLETPSGRDLVRDVIFQEKRKGGKVNLHEITPLLHAYLRAGNVLTSYRSFVFTLDDAERQAMGYVFDPEFRLKPDHRPFAWRIRPGGDVEVDYPWYGSDGKGGLSIQFTDAPARLGNIYQYLALLPGRYHLTVRASANSLVAPKGIYWDMSCLNKSAHILNLPIKDGSYRNKIFSASFTIPPGCPAQILVLGTRLRTPSWRARYRGSIIFHEVRATREMETSEQ